MEIGIGIFKSGYGGDAERVFTGYGGNRVLNGDFEAGDVNWSKDVNWTIQNDPTFGWCAICLNGGINENLYQSNILVVGRRYRIIWTLVEKTSGSVRNFCGTTFGVGSGAIGTYTEDLLCMGVPHFYIRTVGGGPHTLKIDNVSVREIIYREEDE